MGGVAQSGCLLGPAVPNLDDRRRLARSRAGELHAIVHDGPIPPECAGICWREALGGGWLQEFRASIREKMFVSVLEAGFLWRVRVLQGPATRHGTITSVCPWCR